MRSIALKLIALLVFACLSYYATTYVTEDDLIDLKIYLYSAERLSRGESIYNVRYAFPLRATDFELQYLYPPALAALLAPLVSISTTIITPIITPIIIFVWQCGSIIALALTAYMLAQLLSGYVGTRRSPANSYVLFLLLALWPPTLYGIAWGQVNAFILALLVGAAFFTSKRRDRLAGLSLGLAIALKATPAILIVPFIVNKRWRALFYCCLGALAAHLPLMLYPNGLATIQSFLSTVGKIAAGQVVKDPFYDYSLRHFAPFFVDAPATLFLVFSLSLITAYLVLLFRMSRRSVNGAPQSLSRDLLCAFQLLSGIPIMIITSPLVWFHHLVWLFPPLAAVMFLGKTAFIRGSGRLIYIILAPLLYVHVFIRHWEQPGEWIIKTLPLFLSVMTFFLLAKLITRHRTE